MPDVILYALATIGACTLLCVAGGLWLAWRAPWEIARPEPAQAPQERDADEGNDDGAAELWAAVDRIMREARETA